MQNVKYLGATVVEFRFFNLMEKKKKKKKKKKDNLWKLLLPWEYEFVYKNCKLNIVSCKAEALVWTGNWY